MVWDELSEKKKKKSYIQSIGEYYSNDSSLNQKPTLTHAESCSQSERTRKLNVHQFHQAEKEKRLRYQPLPPCKFNTSAIMGPDISLYVETKQDLANHSNQEQEIDLPVSAKASPKNYKPAATMNLEKFKAEQDLKIDTINISLKSAPCTLDSKGTSSSVTPTTDSSSSIVTPTAPTSSGRKRRRRCANQIDRKFKCDYPGCEKAYGSEGSLTQHQRLKHRHDLKDRCNLNGYFMSLPSTLRGDGPTANAFNGSSGRNVNIRPATSTASLLSQVPFDILTSSKLGEKEVVNPLEVAQYGRSSLRSRSNSMPVSFPGVTVKVSEPSSSVLKSVTPRTPSRRSRTPRNGGQLPRRFKSRSKSECMSYVPMPHSLGTFSVQLTAPPEESHPELEEKRYCSSMSSTSDENTIDSEILALLVDDNSSENDSPSDSNSERNQKYIVDMELLESYEDKREILRGDNQQESDCLDEDWLLDEGAIYLSNHLEKMTMIPSGSGVEDFLPAVMSSSGSEFLDLEKSANRRQVSIDLIGSGNIQGFQLENVFDASRCDANAFWCQHGGASGPKDLVQREIEMELNQRNSLDFSVADSNQITEVTIKEEKLSIDILDEVMMEDEFCFSEDTSCPNPLLDARGFEL